MRYWDTSAIVPLLVREPRSARAEELVRWDEELVVWWATPVECWSALSRLQRDGVITQETEDEASRRLEVLRGTWYEVVPSEELRVQCRRLLRLHRLRAADALQLAAALLWAGKAGEDEVVSADDRLSDAARLEGLQVIRL